MRPRLRLMSGLFASLALGGCAVVSETPLFSPQVAATHPLAPGLWAMSGPGCDVGPGRMPDCALPITIANGRMDWALTPKMLRTLGPAAVVMAALPFPKSSAYVLADGDPLILELLNGEPTTPLGASTAPAAGRLPPLKPGYLALRAEQLDGAGRIDRAVVWAVACPPDPATAPGFSLAGGKCAALTAEAVRGQAHVMAPLQSAFLTWVGPAPAQP